MHGGDVVHGRFAAAGAFQFVPFFVVAHGAAAVRAFVEIGFDKGV